MTPRTMRVSKNDVDALARLLKKMEQDRKHEKMRIKHRRKSQIKGKKTVSRLIQKRSKPVTRRRPAKRRASMR